MYWKHDENEQLVTFACRTCLSQLLLMQALTLTFRAAGDCSREDCHAVYGMIRLFILQAALFSKGRSASGNCNRFQHIHVGFYE
ncbi:MAG TPA: hypothetical protein DEB39_03175 [Planctomycetaceae bacterium]|nr:hypothetical protein [Planctomycetaceae bacterium]